MMTDITFWFECAQPCAATIDVANDISQLHNQPTIQIKSPLRPFKYSPVQSFLKSENQFKAMVLEPREYPEIDFTQGELPVPDSMLAEFRDEISPRRLANARAIFDVIELLGRQYLLDAEHVARMKAHMSEPGQAYLEYMYQQLGIGMGLPADNERNIFARLQRMDLESEAFDNNKEQMFEFLVAELGVHSWRRLGECLKQPADFLDSIEADPNRTDLNDKMQAVLGKFEEEYRDYAMHNNLGQALCRLNREDVEVKMDEMLAVIIDNKSAFKNEEKE